MFQNGLFLFILNFAHFLRTGNGNQVEADFCDDGKKGIEIDLHGEKDWKCMQEKWNFEDIPNSLPSMDCYNNHGGHVCIKDSIDNLYPSDYIPVMGPHRQVWAEYGEYKYCPPGRYVHNLEHGGIVYMYHPCVPSNMIEQLRFIAKSCTWKYVITAFANLTKEYPIAVLSYGCIFKMSQINTTDIRDWVQMQIGRSPESDVYGQGKYSYNLVEASKVPENMSDVDCIELGSEIDIAHSTPDLPLTPIEDSIKTPRTDEAAWAVASLVFLLCSVIFGLCYSQLLRSNKHESTEMLNQRSGNVLSVGAMIRKFPNVLKPSRGKTYIKNKSSNQYKLIEDAISSNSEDEIL